MYGHPEEILPWVAWISAFLLGSVPFGLLVAKLFHVSDLQKRGSGNIGATNVARVLGFWPAGAITLVLDLCKGIIPVALVMPAGAGLWLSAVGVPYYEFTRSAIWGVGLAAVLGHCFSPWLRFKGGKGVATGFGAVLLLSPWAALIGAGAFLLSFLSSRIGSLSSISGLVAASVAQVVLFPSGIFLLPGALMIFVILLRHESNIDALLESRERTF